MEQDDFKENAFRFGRQEGWQVAVVIPARNEQKRIEQCLLALAVSFARAGVPGGVILVVNNSDDATAGLARQWCASRPDMPAVLIDYHCSAPLAGVGLARRKGLDAALSLVCDNGVMMTSDADALVEPDWIAMNLAELERADLICGTVLPCEDELARLPDSFARHGAAEGAYMQAVIRLIDRLDPQPHNPKPAHRNAAGASLAFRAPLYADIGGMPDLPHREDRVFVENAEARDWRISFAETPVVRASCRLTGRTGGGMAAALRARIEENDPLCDELLEPARTAILRYGMKGQLRKAWPDRQKMADLLKEVALPERLDQIRHFGTFWRQVEDLMPGLALVRLRQQQLPAEQKILDDWLSEHTVCMEIA